MFQNTALRPFGIRGHIGTGNTEYTECGHVCAGGCRFQQKWHSRSLELAVRIPDASKLDFSPSACDGCHSSRRTGTLRGCRRAVPSMPERRETVCRLIDCLITAVAIRSNVLVLHCDRDFHVLRTAPNFKSSSGTDPIM